MISGAALGVVTGGYVITLLMPNVPSQLVVLITSRKRSLRRLCFYTCLSVILFTGGHAWLWGVYMVGGRVCMVAGGAMHGYGGHAWLQGACMLVGGVCLWGCVWLWECACLWGVHACRGHAWLWGVCMVVGRHAWLWGACMVVEGMRGGGGRAWDTMRYGQ